MRFIVPLLAILLLLQPHVFAQESPVYKLEERLMSGDKSALFDIAPYFDSKKKLTEFLGYHILHPEESGVAKRIVEENCVFLPAEINIEKATAKEFLSFLQSNSDHISFSKLADAFLIVPLEQRSVKVDFRQITPNKITELRSHNAELLDKDWVIITGIGSLIKSRDPKALLLIASELHKRRYRFNKHEFRRNEFIELLQLLTGFEMAVENETKKLTWHIDKEFYPDASLNLLIYFAKNYTQFKWDTTLARFSNTEIQPEKSTREQSLFQQLSSEDDSVAIAAFEELTRADPQTVITLADEYYNADIQTNYALPTFPYRFLKSLAMLTSYGKTNNIDVFGTAQLRAAIVSLQSNLSFAGRRHIEDSLINNLSLDDITAFEYWCLVREDEWDLTYSAGRILDIFYSKNWQKVLASKEQLKLYLKKSALFERLGIVGVAGKYLKKFTDNGTAVAASLESLKTAEADILSQSKKAITACLTPLTFQEDARKFNDANKDYEIKDVAGKIRQIRKQETDAEKMEDKLAGLLSKINYSQIGTAIRKIENVPHREKRIYSIYSFMESDWGFLIEESFDSTATRKEFLKLYDSLSEYDLYAHYLNKAGVNYKNPDGTFDYDRIFEILKYNVVTAFVGGGNSKQGNEVYSIVKLLELTHGTTLGYPKKLCNSDNMWACWPDDRAKYWMRFLRDKKLLKEKHAEPVSFNY